MTAGAGGAIGAATPRALASYREMLAGEPGRKAWWLLHAGRAAVDGVDPDGPEGCPDFAALGLDADLALEARRVWRQHFERTRAEHEAAGGAVGQWAGMLPSAPPAPHYTDDD